MSPHKYSRFLWSGAGFLILIAFWIGMLASLRNTSQTFDESVHAAGGYTYWRFNDYRFNPENGNLPQRVIALPLLFGNYNFPAIDGEVWKTSQEWDLAWPWFYELGNDADAMNFRGHAAAALLAVALGLLVWRASRQLFGETGGMLSLLLYVLNPSILANGALMTSDTAAALFFFAATWSWWWMLQRLTPARVLVSGLVMGGLFVSKMSAPLMVAIAFALVCVRLIDRTGLPFQILGFQELKSRKSRLLALSGAVVVQIFIAWAVIWGFYGFRYSAFSPEMVPGQWTGETWEAVFDKPSPEILLTKLDLTLDQRQRAKEVFARDRAEETAWPFASVKAMDDLKRETLTKEQAARLDQLLMAPSPHFAGRILETLRHYRLLPEAYIYGFAHVWYGSIERAAFLNGHFSLSGWLLFFPYTFLVKTPLMLFFVIAVALAAIVVRLRQQEETARRTFHSVLYQALPFLILFGFYWVVAISSHLNIGHRHILPTYPPLLVLCGAAAWWFDAASTTSGKALLPVRKTVRVIRVALSIALALLAVEICYRFPHYLAYFNGIVRPACGYRHLVYSSLDWGQDLPQVRTYIETHRPAAPVYLSYFGFASPVYYRVPAVYAYSVPGRYRSPPLQTLTFPADQADALLSDFLIRNREYDDRVVGRARQGDETRAVLVKKAEDLRLTAGTYIISASLLQPITRPQRGAFGHWNARLEKQYQFAVRLTKPILSEDPAERSAALTELSPENWTEAINTYEYLRFHRLAAFLRHRKPDDNIGYSILVYHLDENDLSRALDGPPVELGRDILGERFGISP